MARKKGDTEFVTRMAKKFDGTGVVRVQTSRNAAQRMKLASMPVPQEWGQIINYGRVINMRRHGLQAGSTAYRIQWPEYSNGPGSKLVTSRFSLSSDHINETLFVLAEFLRDQGVEFVGITNKHGSLLRDAGLSGTQLAYLTRDIPHSPACHTDFFVTHPPEVGGTPGRIVDDLALNS